MHTRRKQDEKPIATKGRHAKGPGARSQDEHRATSQGAPEQRGGRERAERRGEAPMASARGRARHGHARAH